MSTLSLEKKTLLDRQNSRVQWNFSVSSADRNQTISSLRRRWWATVFRIGENVVPVNLV